MHKDCQLSFRINAILFNNIFYELRKAKLGITDDEEIQSIELAQRIAGTTIPLNYLGGSGPTDSHQTSTTGISTGITDLVFSPQEAPAFMWPNDGDDREEVVRENIEMDELDGVQWGNRTGDIGTDDTMSQCSGFTTVFAPL